MSQDRKKGNPRDCMAFPTGSEQDVYEVSEIVGITQYNDDGSYYVRDWLGRERRVVRRSVLVFEDTPRLPSMPRGDTNETQMV